MAARILVVEDEPAVQELIRYTLEQAGMETFTAASAEDALAALRDELPDAVLIDWMLPNKSGLALARELRETERTAARVIVLPTGQAVSPEIVATIGTIMRRALVYGRLICQKPLLFSHNAMPKIYHLRTA